MNDEILQYLKEMEERLYRQGWEQARYCAWASLSSVSTKRIKKEDVLKLPWDDEKKDE